MGINLGTVAAVMANFNSVSQRSTESSEKKNKTNVNIVNIFHFSSTKLGT